MEVCVLEQYREVLFFFVCRGLAVCCIVALSLEARSPVQALV